MSRFSFLKLGAKDVLLTAGRCLDDSTTPLAPEVQASRGGTRSSLRGSGVVLGLSLLAAGCGLTSTGTVEATSGGQGGASTETDTVASTAGAGGMSSGSSGPGGMSSGGGSSSSSGGGGAGGGEVPSCVDSADCPDDANPCTESAVCDSDSGMCEYPPADVGTHAADFQQVVGDCAQVVCDGNGATTTVSDVTDPSVDENVCTTEVCVNGATQSMNVPVDTSCDSNGDQACDGAGVCIDSCDGMPAGIGPQAVVDAGGNPAVNKQVVLDADATCSKIVVVQDVDGIDGTGAETELPVTFDGTNDCVNEVTAGNVPVDPILIHMDPTVQPFKPLKVLLFDTGSGSLTGFTVGFTGLDVKMMSSSHPYTDPASPAPTSTQMLAEWSAAVAADIASDCVTVNPASCFIQPSVNTGTPQNFNLDRQVCGPLIFQLTPH